MLALPAPLPEVCDPVWQWQDETARAVSEPKYQVMI